MNRKQKIKFIIKALTRPRFYPYYIELESGANFYTNRFEFIYWHLQKKRKVVSEIDFEV